MVPLGNEDEGTPFGLMVTRPVGVATCTAAAVAEAVVFTAAGELALLVTACRSCVRMEALVNTLRMSCHSHGANTTET